MSRKKHWCDYSDLNDWEKGWIMGVKKHYLEHKWFYLKIRIKVAIGKFIGRFK